MVFALKILLILLILFTGISCFFIIREYRKYMLSTEMSNESIMMKMIILFLVIALNIILVAINIFSWILIFKEITIK